jgi:hypothetical protein
MTRRFLFALPLSLFKGEEHAPPTDIDDLNSFANAYNDYAAKLKQQIVDIKLWNKTLKCWERLNTKAR